MFWGIWLAWASIEVPAWLRIWLRVKFAISRAMSVSRIRDSEAVRFSTATFRLLIVCSRRFWVAPNDDRTDDTETLNTKFHLFSSYPASTLPTAAPMKTAAKTVKM